MEAFNTSYVAGDYQAAIEAMAPSSLMPGEPDKDEQVLELLHQAEAYRLAGEPQTAIDLYDQAEAGMKLNDTDNLAEKGAENALAVLVNDAQRDYRPMLAEAVLVNTYKGLAFLQLGKASNARVEFNRADDRTRRAVAAFAEEIAEQKAALEEQAEADANREQQAIQQSLDSDALHESVAQQYGAPRSGVFTLNSSCPRPPICMACTFLPVAKAATSTVPRPRSRAWRRCPPKVNRSPRMPS